MLNQHTPDQNDTADAWKVKYEEAVKAKDDAEKLAAERERQYNSANGNLVTVTTERKHLQEELKALSDNTEKTKSEIQAEREELTKKIKDNETAEAKYQAQLAQKDDELEVLRLIATEFPDLSDWYGKGRITPGNKKGEELKTFLKGWQDDLAESNLIQRRQSGRVPPPPPGGQNSMTYAEVQDKKVEVARTLGYRSKEYQELVKLEEQLFAEGKYK